MIDTMPREERMLTRREEDELYSRKAGPILGLDVGGTQITACLGTSSGEVTSHITGPSRAADGFDSLWGSVVSIARRLLSQADPAIAIASIGVSIGGPVDNETGVVFGAPNLPGSSDLPLGEMLKSEFGVDVYVEHDAKAGALAEWMYGVGRGVNNMIFLTLGTGIGAGIIVDGRLLRGRQNRLGEVGHWRVAPDGPLVYGKSGSWEGYSSGAGVAAQARERRIDRWGENPTAEQVFKDAAAGNPDAQVIVDLFADKLGSGIALLVDLFAPEVVVLGSLAVRAGPQFLPRVQEIVDRETLSYALPCPVVPARLGERIGMVASLAASSSRS